MVFVNSTLAEMRLAAAANQTAAAGAQNILDQVRHEIASERFLALNLVFKIYLGRRSE